MSTPLYMLNPPTPNSISITTAVTPCQPNVPSLTPSPPMDVTSATILMTSTLTPPLLPEPSTSRGYPVSFIQKQLFHNLHHPKRSCPPPPRPPSPVSHHHLLSWPSPSQTYPQERFPYPLLRSIYPGPLTKPPLSSSENPLTSANSLLTQVSALQAPKPAIHPNARLFPFAIPSTLPPAPALTSLIPSLSSH